jgi:uncharacterized protein (DUF362 family)/Pyruvate/2-oxoacid:ferredoxin oxidoreductase delta subunit
MSEYKVSLLAMKSKVAVLRCNNYNDDSILSAIRHGIDLIGGVNAFVKPGEKILLKPNCLYGAPPDRCITTHPSIVKAVGTICKEASAVVWYGDSPSVGTSSESMETSGYASVAKESGLIFADVDHGRSVTHPKPLVASAFVLSNAALEADGIISLSKLKSHGLTRYTGAVKNQYGCIPGFLKAQYHSRFPDVNQFAEFIVDINTFLKPRLYIIDGIIAMEGNGPGNGTPRSLGVIIFSTDPVAADAVACRIIKLDPQIVPTNIAGEKAGLGTWHPENIELLGDPIHQFICHDFKIVKRQALSASGGKLRQYVVRKVADRPVIDKSKCIKCGKCVDICPVTPKAVDWVQGDKKKSPVHNYDICIRCFCCHEVCPAKAIHVSTPFLGKMAQATAWTIIKCYRGIRALFGKKSNI